MREIRTLRSTSGEGKRVAKGETRALPQLYSGSAGLGELRICGWKRSDLIRNTASGRAISYSKLTARFAGRDDPEVVPDSGSNEDAGSQGAVDPRLVESTAMVRVEGDRDITVDFKGIVAEASNNVPTASSG